MNKTDLNMRREFVTLEDVSECKEDMNYVIWNFNKTEDERIQEFVKCMKKKYSHVFTKKELDCLCECDNPMKGGLFIKRVRSLLNKE